MLRSTAAAALLTLAMASGAAGAGDKPARPRFDENGVVQVPAFELPPSAFASEEAKALLKARARMPADLPTMEPDVAKSRAALQRMLAPQVEAMLSAYPVDVADDMISGVPVKVFTPKGGKWDKRRVLINLHGGAFQTCWDACAYLESAPIAALGKYKVVSVNYRMAPEAKHPAGVEDAVAVYRDLARRLGPKRIGIFGCSAGGSLTAQTAARLAKDGTPQPGAIGIFGAGAVRFMAGDSAYIAANIDGSFPPPARPGAPVMDLTRGYFEGADMSDEIISPAMHPEILAKFPPTLLITGTRAMDLSPAIVTNSQLLKAGVPSTLIVGESMGHCYIYRAELPESRDAYEATVQFFRQRLR